MITRHSAAGVCFERGVKLNWEDPEEPPHIIEMGNVSSRP